MNDKIRYYYIEHLGVLGKAQNHLYYVFSDGKWVHDTECLIPDRLYGYDPYESYDSPYKMGYLDKMNERAVISEEEAQYIMAHMTSDNCK